MADAAAPLRPRPAGVAFVLGLTWFVAIVDLVGGLALFLVSFSRTAFDHDAVDAVLLRYFALFVVVIGLLTVLVALGLATGSQFARVVTIGVMALRLINALWALIVLHAFIVWEAAFEAGMAILIIALLSTNSASDYFRKRPATSREPITETPPGPSLQEEE